MRFRTAGQPQRNRLVESELFGGPETDNRALGQQRLGETVRLKTVVYP
jgi:hypothetical protein